QSRRIALLASLGLAFAAGSALGPLGQVGAKDGDLGVRVAFSPGGGIEPALLDVIKDAKGEILIAMYNLTSRPLAEALARAKQRGVDVRIILDKQEAFQKYGKLNDLRKAKCVVRLMQLGKTGDNQQIRFHHK